MNVKLLTEQHLEFLSLKEGLSESSLVKIPRWKSCVTAHFSFDFDRVYGILHDLIRACISDALAFHFKCCT